MGSSGSLLPTEREAKGRGEEEVTAESLLFKALYSELS